MKWYKKTFRREEIKMLMQGLSLPSPSVCTPQPLPPARQHPSSAPPTPTYPHSLHEDTIERASIWGSSRQSTPVSLPVQSTSHSIVPMTIQDTPVFEPVSFPTKMVQLKEVEVQTTTMPRRTTWRQRKRTPAIATLPEAQARRKYTCTICGKPMASPGHTRFYGKQYCPNAPRQIPKQECKQEWLAQRRAEKRGRSN